MVQLHHLVGLYAFHLCTNVGNLLILNAYIFGLHIATTNL